MSELTDIMHEFGDHVALLRLWSTLMTPNYADAGVDIDTKKQVSLLAHEIGKTLDALTEDLSAYHSDRAENVRKVRTSFLHTVAGRYT